MIFIHSKLNQLLVCEKALKLDKTKDGINYMYCTRLQNVRAMLPSFSAPPPFLHNFYANKSRSRSSLLSTIL